jgi:hypothetical protein
MLGIILPIAAFYVFVTIFSNNRASEVRWKIFLVALTATLTLSAISRSNPTLVGLVTACVVAALVSFGGLVWWIKATRTEALKVTGSYVSFVLAYSIVVEAVFRAFMNRAL